MSVYSCCVELFIFIEPKLNILNNIQFSIIINTFFSTYINRSNQIYQLAVTAQNNEVARIRGKIIVLR